MRLEGRLTTHNVGQGLFYSGKLEIDNLHNIFNFVYDCGSERQNYLKRVVDYYKRNILSNSILDLVIISHLHNDHIIGLEHLLNNIKVNTVILPYMSPVERLIIALKKINLPDWYYKFLAEPIQYLMEKDVNRIILIGGKGGEPGAGFNEIKNELSEEKIDLKKLDKDERLEEFVFKNEPEVKHFIDKGKLLIKNHYGYISIFGLWGFRFFNCEVDQEQLYKFKKCVNQIINKIEIKEIIRTKSKLKLLRSCYEYIFGKSKLNNTSLSIFTGPLGTYKKIYHIPNLSLSNFNFWSRIFPYFYPHRYPKHLLFSINYIGNLLTGDLDLNFSWKDFYNHFLTNFSQTFIIQVPHHGSKHNWKVDLLDKINYSFWIISSGFKNRFGHPHKKVITDIINCFPSKVSFWVNEFMKFELGFEIFY